MSKKDYYDILGVNKNATDKEIKDAFRSKSKKFHPDKEGGDEEKFKEINEAYSILSNSTQRSKYDQFGHDMNQYHHGFNNHFHDDILNNFMRNHGFGFNQGFEQQVRRGQDLTVNLKLTLEEIYKGVNKKFNYRRNDTCKSCIGKGGNGEITCPTCNGQGRVINVMDTPMGRMQTINACPTCESNGKIVEHICNKCNGQGLEQIIEEIDINIPAGINDGSFFNLGGKGNGIKNGVCGNLKVIITELPHNTFIRYGNDLKQTLKLTYSQLVLGDKIDINTIDGKKIRVSIPEYSDINDNLRIVGKGMKIMDFDSYGDLILILDIEIPKKVSDKEKELIIDLRQLEKN